MIVLVLAHGVLGFGANPFGLGINVPEALAYFRGVRGSIKQDVIKVIEPSVDPLGAIATRVQGLVTQLLATTQDGDHVYVIAHSMGGLDFLQAYRNPLLAQRIKGIATIGTPYLGSEVADAILNSNSPLAAHIPAVLKAILQSVGPALQDLTTAIRMADRMLCNVRLDCPGYLIAGNVNIQNNASRLFQLAQKLGSFATTDTDDPVNDGVVTRTSAHYPVTLNLGWQTLPDWPMDHGGEIGWSFDWLFRLKQDHLARYHQLINLLTGIPVAEFAR